MSEVESGAGRTLPAPRRFRKVRVIDSHTEGEPTRVVVEGGPDLGNGSLAERRDRFRTQHDTFRGAVVGEPRGRDPLVGALLTRPHDPTHLAGVVFFNNAGYLGMCGHGTIGLVETLAHLGQIAPGNAVIETPVGDVRTELRSDGRVTFWNVPSYRHRTGVRLDVARYGTVVGDVAWGGNWFFLIDVPSAPSVTDSPELLRFCHAVQEALHRGGITGAEGAAIDHIELSGPPVRPENNSRNFVLCPDGAYDRSPCGTGTSARVACLVADGRLAPGATWRQEGVRGGVFEATAERVGDSVVPRITGRAVLTAESDLLFDEGELGGPEGTR
jgi:4-hydroxyproline epimerase